MINQLFNISIPRLSFTLIFVFGFYFLFLRNYLSQTISKWLFISYIYNYSRLLFILIIQIINFEIAIEPLYYLSFYLIQLLLLIFFCGINDRFIFVKIVINDFFVLIRFLIIGGIVLLRLQTFRDFFICLEIITLGSYALVTIKRDNRFSTYVGVQYFILGSIPSARLILSFGLFYYYGGSLSYQDFDLLFNNNLLHNDIYYDYFITLFLNIIDD